MERVGKASKATQFMGKVELLANKKMDGYQILLLH
jgi:hypothetical protein